MSNIITTQIVKTRQIGEYTFRLELSGHGYHYLYIDNNETDSNIYNEVVKFRNTDRNTALESIARMPWETPITGSNSLGYMYERHCLVCEDCAKNLHCTEYGSIEAVDVMHVSRMECDQCGTYVGEQCSNEEIGCTEYAGDEDSSFCETCQNIGGE